MAAVIYSNGSQECERMAQLLKSLGSEFLEYKLNHHFSQRGFEAEFGKGATYPQVNIGFEHTIVPFLYIVKLHNYLTI